MTKGSSAFEKRDKAEKRMLKNQLRHKADHKKRKRQGEEDTSDTEGMAHANALTPTERRHQENGVNPLSSLHKKKQKLEKKESNKTGLQDHLLGGNKITAESLPSPDFSGLQPFSKSFWTGPAGEESPSDELKELRKSIGVNVKGQLQQCPPPALTAASAGLPAAFASSFDKLKMTTPSAVQMQCWPALLAGANVLALAPTGSGKTLAYGLPMVPHLQAAAAALLPRAGCNVTEKAHKQHTAKPAPAGLVVVPTRELAIQVSAELKRVFKLFGLRVGAVYGGAEKEEQLLELAMHGGVHVAVATPGRLLDLVAAKQISLLAVQMLVLDEADRMLQMGFFDQLQAISQQVRPDRQTSLFSATFPGRLREAADLWVGDAVFVRCSTFDVGSAGNKQAEKEKEEKKEKKEKEEKEEKGAEPADTSNSKAAKGAAASKDSSSHAIPSSSAAAHAGADGGSSTALSVPQGVTQLVHVCAQHKKPRCVRACPSFYIV